MKRVLLIVIVLLVMAGTSFGAGISKKEKKCHRDCANQKQEAIQQCLDSKVWPLSKCLKKASDNKKECLKQCTKKKG